VDETSTNGIADETLKFVSWTRQNNKNHEQSNSIKESRGLAAVIYRSSMRQQQKEAELHRACSRRWKMGTETVDKRSRGRDKINQVNYMKHIIKGIVGASALFTIGFGIVECTCGQELFWQNTDFVVFIATVVGLGVVVLSLVGETERSEHV